MGAADVTELGRHGCLLPLYPEAIGFVGRCGFVIDVLAAERPTGKGRVERQVLMVRDHVLSGPVLLLHRVDGCRLLFSLHVHTCAVTWLRAGSASSRCPLGRARWWHA